MPVAAHAEVPVTPFVKWAGGKTQLLNQILPRLPARAKTYYEPFVGGGAVFFAMASRNRFDRAVLADRNPDLVSTYLAVRDRVEPLIKRLGEHQAKATDETYFYEMRAVDPDQLDPVARAARFLFLNKTCFNGLYRVNRSGRFNVPFGRYKNPRVQNPEGLRAASHYLKGVTILESDFESVAREVRRGDAIYFDPPYVPVSATASFTSYARHPFGPDEHDRLLEAYLRCCRRGAHALLSNSDCPVTRALYDGLDVETVKATRAINSRASGRGAINELLVVGPGVRGTRRGRVRRADDAALPPTATRRKRKVS